jgi:O-antigen/teichoic acid export membrane protein
MSLGRNVMASLVAVAITAVTGVVALGLLAHLLTPEEFGALSLILVLFNFFVFFDGSRAVVVRLWHRHPGDRPIILGSSLMISSSIALLLTFACAALIQMYFGLLPAATAVTLGIAIGLHFPGAVLWGVLDAQERVGFTALLRAVAWASAYVGFVVFAAMRLSLQAYAITLVIMNAVLLVVMAMAAWRSGCRLAMPRRGILWVYLRNSLRMLVFNIFAAIITAWDRLVLAKLMPISTLGFYSLQVELGIRGRVLVNGISRVLYPRFCRQAESEPIGSVIAGWMPWIRVFMVLMTLICLLIITWSEPLLALYAGPAYAEYHYVLQVVLAMLPINALGILAIVVQRADLDFSSQPVAYGVAVIFGLLAVYPLVSRFGLQGALIVYCILRLGDLFVALMVATNTRQAGVSWWKIAATGCVYSAMITLQLADRVGWSWIVALALVGLLLKPSDIRLVMCWAQRYLLDWPARLRATGSGS